MNAPNITDAIFARAARQPHAAAVIDDESVISYQTLCRAVRATSGRLRAAGWRAGDVIGIDVADRQVLHLLASLAMAHSGIVQMALPASEPAAVQTERIRRTGIAGVVSDGSRGAPVPVLRIDGSWLSPGTVEDLRVPGGTRLWIVAETSGTTAEPKLAGISHAVEQAHAHSQSPLFAHLPGERFLNLSPLRFLTALKRAFCCLADGGTLVLPPANIPHVQALQWIKRFDVAYLSCVPAHLHQMLREWPAATAPRLPWLRLLRTSSAALPVATLEAVRARVSPNVYVNYGATEAGPMVAAPPELLARHPQAVGMPLPGIEVQIVDADDRPCAVGATGRLRVRGEGVLSAYLRAVPAEAAQVFRGGWCYPGDLGHVNAEGVIFLEGRSDEAMNFNGIMIHPAEIEAVLGDCPQVEEVAAFALPAAESQHVPAAAVVVRDGLPMAALQQYGMDRLGARAPLLIVPVAVIPRNAAGKVLRRQLADEVLARLRAGGSAGLP